MQAYHLILQLLILFEKIFILDVPPTVLECLNGFLSQLTPLLQLPYFIDILVLGKVMPLRLFFPLLLQLPDLLIALAHNIQDLIMLFSALLIVGLLSALGPLQLFKTRKQVSSERLFLHGSE